MIDEECRIFPSVVLGCEPQVLSLNDETGSLLIGKRTVIREFVTIHRSIKAQDCTSIGEDCYLMNGVHVGHDCEVSNRVIFASFSACGGHTKIQDDVFVSRTFCLHEDIEKIKKLGLAKGGSLENAIVVKNNDILNPDGLRNKKEFVNHKILDCIGDLYTAGYRIIGSVQCSKGGHYLTNQLLRKVFSNKDNFSIIEIKEKNLPHTLINRNLLKSIA